jgi:hypothetical protein
MPALLSEVFKETSYTVNDGQIKPHYGKPAEKEPTVQNVSCDQVIQHLSSCIECQQKIAAIMNKNNNNIEIQLQEMQQKINTLEQAGGNRFDIIAFAEQNPVLVLLALLIGIDIFKKAFLK